MPERYLRTFLLLLLDSVFSAGALLLAFWLRFDVQDIGIGNHAATFHQALPWLLLIRAVCGLLTRQYTWSFLHASLAEAARLVQAHFAGTALLVALFHFGELVTPPPPRSIYILELAMTMMAVLFVRFFPRYLHQWYIKRAMAHIGEREHRLRTLIFGAGGVGELLLRDINRTRVYPYSVIGFVDDDRTKIGATIHGIQVLGASKDLPDIIRDYAIEKILIAVPDLPTPKLRSIVDLCNNAHIRFKIVPSFSGLVWQSAEGHITLKDVQPEDLLERVPVEFDHGRMASLLVDRTALVTGGAGSIGSELCRQICRNGLKRLIAVDMNENDLYFLRLDLADIAPKTEVILEVASVRDADRMAAIFQRYRPALVFHAAAHKHVPLMEHCPSEALQNNVLGTWNVADCACRFGAERFVLISSDKAVRSTNVMGATKRMAELVIRHCNSRHQTRLMAVRFGNVLGSNGSLLPILERQIAKGGPVTVTHPAICRYFMTIPEAVGLVLIAMVQEEGELCVLDMGEPINIDRLARQLISLKGLIPDKDIHIEYSGLRPGEKMYEELFGQSERLTPSSHPRIMVANHVDDTGDVPQMLQEIRELPSTADAQLVRSLLRRYVRDYRPEEKADSAAQRQTESPVASTR